MQIQSQVKLVPKTEETVAEESVAEESVAAEPINAITTTVEEETTKESQQLCAYAKATKAEIRIPSPMRRSACISRAGSEIYCPFFALASFLSLT